MEGTDDTTGQQKLNVYLGKLRKRESVDGIPHKLFGNEDAHVLTLLHSFDETVDEGRVAKSFFDSTINNIKKSEEEPYEEAKKLKSSAAVDHRVTDCLNGIGLFPIQLEDMQPYTPGITVAQFEERAVEYMKLGIEFYEFVEALRWTYDAAAIQKCNDKNVLPESLLTENSMQVYRSIIKGRIGNLLLDETNLKFWNNKNRRGMWELRIRDWFSPLPELVNENRDWRKQWFRTNVCCIVLDLQFV